MEGENEWNLLRTSPQHRRQMRYPVPCVLACEWWGMGRKRIRRWFVEGEGGRESTERIYAYQTGESCPVRVLTTSFFSRSTTR